MSRNDPHRIAAELALVRLEAHAQAMLRAAGFPPGLTRMPTPAEVASRTNFAGIEDDVRQAASEIAAAARAGRDQALRAIATYLAQFHTVYDLIGATDLLAAGLAALPGADRVVHDVAVEANARLLDLAATSAVRLAEDAVAGGIRAVTGPPALTPEMFASVNAQARRVGAEAVVSAVRSIRGAAYTTPRDVGPDAFHDLITSAARDASARALDDVASQAALHANGVGRRAALGSLTSPVRLYASELLDRNTCTPCSHVDGTSYPDQAAADRDYPEGRYVDCEGGDRCRGTIVAVAASESTATLVVPGTLARARRAVGGLPAVR